MLLLLLMFVGIPAKEPQKTSLLARWTLVEKKAGQERYTWNERAQEQEQNDVEEKMFQDNLYVSLQMAEPSVGSCKVHCHMNAPQKVGLATKFLFKQR